MPMGVYFPLDICEGISAHVLSSGFLGDTYKEGKKFIAAREERSEDM